MTGIDVAIILIYLVGVLIFGTWLGRGIKTDEDYFLAGRKLPFWAIGMSIVVSDIGAIDFVALCGASYKYGVAAANMDWIGTMPAIVLAAFVFLPFYWRAGVYTVPEYLGRRYNAAVRGIQSVAWTIFLVVNLGVSFWASAALFDTVLGSSALEWLGVGAGDTVMDAVGNSTMHPDAYARRLVYIAITGVVTGIYTISGGLAAVVYTDVVQLFVMFAGALCVIWIGLYDAELGVGGLVQLRTDLLGAGHDDHFTLFLPHDTPTPFPWTGVLFGLALVQAPAYFIGNQTLVQRSLGARDEWSAKAGALFGGLLKFFIPLIVVLPGLIALRIVPGLGDQDTAYAELIKRLLPTGLRGLVFAAFLAAMMSTVDSILSSAATMVTRDGILAWSRWRPKPLTLLRVGRWVTLILLLLGMAASTQMGTKIFEGVYAVIQAALSIVQGPSWALLLIGMFWRRATGVAGLVALIAGLASSTGMTVIHKWQIAHGRPTWFPSNEPFMFVALYSFLITAAVLIAVSLVTRPKSNAELRGLVFRATDDDAELDAALKARERGGESP
jgi:SSS family solute:Na+ symporter